MMKFIVYMFLMIPLCFMGSYFWLIQFLFFILFVFYGFEFMFNYFSSLSYGFGCDYFSFFMILLSIWICPLMVMSSWLIYLGNYYVIFVNLVILFLLISLYFTFCSMNLFIFWNEINSYFIFNFGVGVSTWSNSSWCVYTLFGSLPMMISLLYMTLFYNSLDYYFFFDYLNKFYLFICTIFVFLYVFFTFMVTKSSCSDSSIWLLWK